MKNKHLAATAVLMLILGIVLMVCFWLRVMGVRESKIGSH